MRRVELTVRWIGLAGVLWVLSATAACSGEPAPAANAGADKVDAGPGPGQFQAIPGAPGRQVTVNGVRLDAAQLVELERRHGLQVVDGNYWYDRMSGAAGPVGGPTLAFILPGLELGGALAPDASAGDSGVFINGRELPDYDLVGLTRLVGYVAPGRYFLDAVGNAGPEGGPPVVNLVVASHQAERMGGTGSGGWYSGATGAGGNEAGGSGYVMGKDGSGNTWISSY